MSVLLHPTISWQGWQEVRRSRSFQQLAPKDRIRLINQLPHSLWAWEMSDTAEIDELLESLSPDRQGRD